MPYLVLSPSSKAAGTFLFKISPFQVHSISWLLSDEPAHVHRQLLIHPIKMVSSDTCSEGNCISSSLTRGRHSILHRIHITNNEVLIQHQADHPQMSSSWLHCTVGAARSLWNQRWSFRGRQLVSWSFKLIDDEAKRQQKINKKPDRSGYRCTKILIINLMTFEIRQPLPSLTHPPLLVRSVPSNPHTSHIYTIPVWYYGYWRQSKPWAWLYSDPHIYLSTQAFDWGFSGFLYDKCQVISLQSD